MTRSLQSIVTLDIGRKEITEKVNSIYNTSQFVTLLRRDFSCKLNTLIVC